jgi:hypothetical protein
MKRLRKTISLLLMLSLLVGVFSVTLIPSATETLAASTLIVNKRGDDSGGMTGKFLRYNGSSAVHAPGVMPVYWLESSRVKSDGTAEPFPVYCIDPADDGPVELGHALYSPPDLQDVMKDPVAYGIVTHGFPYKKPWTAAEDLKWGSYEAYCADIAGIKELDPDTAEYLYGCYTEEEAYYATLSKSISRISPLSARWRGNPGNHLRLLRRIDSRSSFPAIPPPPLSFLYDISS